MKKICALSLVAGAAVILLLAMLLSVAGCSSADRLVGVVGRLTPTTEAPALGQVVITSDQSVILPEKGATYQFAAVVKDPSGKVLDQPVTWQSGDPAAVSLSAVGLATAQTALGSATITASSPGAQPGVANAIVAQPAPGTVILSSSDVISVDAGSAVLALNDRTRALVAGDTLVTGSDGGLFGKVRATQIVGSQVNVEIAPAVFTKAFKSLDINISGAVQPVITNESTGQTGWKPPIHFPLAMLGGGPVGLSGGVEFSPPGVDVRVTRFEPILVLNTEWFGVKEFKLALRVTTSYSLNFGSITFSGKAEKEAKLKLLSRELAVPSALCLGPCQIWPEVELTAGADFSAKADAAMTVAGPEIGATLEGTYGIAFTDKKGWQGVSDTKPVKPLAVQEASAKYAGGFKVEIDPYVHLDGGFSAKLLGLVEVADVDLAFAHADSSLYLGIDAPLDSHAAGYAGPKWGGSLELSAGPAFKVQGEITRLWDFIGLAKPSAAWKMVDLKVDMPGSVDPVVKVDPAPAPSGPVALSAEMVGGLPTPDGLRVDFVGYKDGAAQGTVLGSGTLRGGKATATWQPPTGETGDYQVRALLFDPVFGAVGLPYASSTAAQLALSDVEVTYESSESPCLIKEVFTKGGKDYVVVDYIQIVQAGVDEDGNANLVIVNKNPKLRTFEMPAGAAMTSDWTLDQLLGGDAYAARAYRYGGSPPITVDELRQAIAEGCINGGPYESWVIKVSNGRVISLKQERGG